MNQCSLSTHMSGLVVGDDALVLGRHDALALQPPDDAVRRRLEVAQVDALLVLARREDGRLVADVRDLCARKPRCEGSESGSVLRLLRTAQPPFASFRTVQILTSAIEGVQRGGEIYRQKSVAVHDVANVHFKSGVPPCKDSRIVPCVVAI